MNMKKLWNIEAGLTLVEVIVVLVIVAILASAALSRFIDLSKAADAAACRTNQLSLQTAQTIKNTESVITTGQPGYAGELDQLAPYLKNNILPLCPSGGQYIITDPPRVECSLPEHCAK